MLYKQNETGVVTFEEVSALIKQHIAENNWKNVLILPPDISRFHSGAGPITALYYDELTARGCSVKVMPALGTHIAMTKEELLSLGMRYAIGATHWRIDQPGAKQFSPDLEPCIREWYRQQLWMANDERVTVLGHPWCMSRGIWYQDFSVIPRSANMEIAAALKENGKYVECNAHFFVAGTSEKFRHQYAEYMREMFEMGIPVIYGSDAHNTYTDNFRRVEPYLAAAGFRDGDICEIAEADLW